MEITSLSKVLENMSIEGHESPEQDRNLLIERDDI